MTFHKYKCVNSDCVTKDGNTVFYVSWYAHNKRTLPCCPECGSAEQVEHANATFEEGNQ